MELLSHLNEVTTEDISNFKAKCNPKYLRKLFDDQDEQTQHILVFLNSLSTEDLIDLVNHERQNGRIPAIHSILTHLISLHMLTNDDRYTEVPKKINE